MYGAHSKFDNDMTSTEYQRGRAIAWLQGGNTQRNVAVRLGVSQSVVGRLWQPFQATNSVRNRPRSGRPRSTTNREDRYITNMALQSLHADYVTICGLRLELECLIKPYAIVWEPIIYAAVARLFDHHSYHVTERPDVIGACFICGSNVLSGVEWCSLMNPGLVSSSTTVGFMSTDVLGSASLTLTLDNVTGSVVAASWCGAASLSTTGPPSMWWMAIWQESAISMRLSGRWFYQAFSRLAAGQFCRMTMPDPTTPGWWLTFSDNKVSPGWIGQHIRLTWPQ